jgi:branched-chain amino acid transport system substrate-binding protein
MLASRRQFVSYGLGCALAGIVPSKKAFGQEKPINIGHQLDISAYQATYAFALDLGAKAAVKYINDQGGIAGRPIHYVVEDTASDVPTGIRKFRRLVETQGCDFIFGDVQSGINLATNPVAAELKTIYFPQGESSAVTGAKSNRYVFRLRAHSGLQGQASMSFAMEKLGKNFFFIITDYAYGHAFVSDLTPLIEAAGGKVLGKIAVPVNTDDMLPFLANVPQAADVLFSVFVGPDALRYIRQGHEMGLSKRARLAPWGMIDATSLAGTENALEGMHFLSQSPRYLDQVPDSLRPFVAKARELMGVANDSSLVSDPKRLVASSYYLSTWQGIFMLKDAIEKVGWKTKADHPKLIEALESYKGTASLAYPMGDFAIRPEDHQSFPQMAIEQVRGGKLVRIADIRADPKRVPIEVDLRKQSF